MKGIERRTTSAGFTLVEVLVAVAISALVMVAVTAIGIVGVTQMSSESRARNVDAKGTQWASMAFARDVQGASGIAADPCPNADGNVVTFQDSDGGRRVGYWTRESGDGLTLELLRTVCTPSAPDSTDLLAEGLSIADPPVALCDDVPCTPESPVRVARLSASSTRGFLYSLDGARRTFVADAPPEVPVPDEPEPMDIPRLFLLGGSGTPIAMVGNAELIVHGDTYLNGGSNPNAVTLSGNAVLTVTGEFRIQEGYNCAGCTATHVSPFPPGTFEGPLPDPFAELAAPDPATLTPRNGCPGNVCQPGYYPDPLSFNNQAEVTMLPGIYVLGGGLSLSGQATLSGEEVFIYNEAGSFGLTGGGRVQLTPQTTGTYAGILFFQSGANHNPVLLRGNGNTDGSDGNSTVLGGMLYSPGDGGFRLSGNGLLRLGTLIGRDITASGNGRFEINVS